MVRRQNSFGRDLCDGGVGVGSGGARLLPSNNPTPTFCTLPRDSKACEVCIEHWQYVKSKSRYCDVFLFPPCLLVLTVALLSNNTYCCVRILLHQHLSRSTPTDVMEPSSSLGLGSAASRWPMVPHPPGSPVPRPRWFNVPTIGKMTILVMLTMMMYVSGARWPTVLVLTRPWTFLSQVSTVLVNNVWQREQRWWETWRQRLPARWQQRPASVLIQTTETGLIEDDWSSILF